MSFTIDQKQKFTDLLQQIEQQDTLCRSANGGNSILFSYPPHEESLYITRAKECLTDNTQFIDITQLLIELIDEDGWDAFSSYYEDFKATPHLVFKSNSNESDLFNKIIRDIEKASNEDKIPVLIKTGNLYGTGIDCHSIMEHKLVMQLPHPLVIFYPSRLDGEQILFLGFKPASKYRCALVQ